VATQLRNSDHTDWIVVGCTRYGDEPATGSKEEAEAWEVDSKARNLRGQAYRNYDQSGLVTNLGFDFRGNLLEVQRRIALAYEGDIDWRSALDLPLEGEPDSLLMAETFHLINEYDALNRAKRQYQFHQGPGSRVAVIEPSYNQRNLLQQQVVVLEAVKTDEAYQGGTRIPMVREVTYNEKGQRLSIGYDNNTTTTYEYDPNTFHLSFLQTRRHTDNNILQELNYTYDPAANITEIIDNAQPAVFFNNFRVEAHNRYSYDALYRLIEAQGREHAGQAVNRDYDNWHDCDFRKRYHPNDNMAWRNYTVRYQYDAVGNILRVQHRATDNNWIRQYQYARTSNRLLATGMGNGPVANFVDTPSLLYRYDYNDHGSMISMPHLQTMNWNFTEHLYHIARTTGTISEDGDGCTDASLQAWYRYDGGKQRVRKRVLKQDGSVAERLYLAGIEIYREYNRDEELRLERETLHVMDDSQRIAMVETRTAGNDGSPEQLVRYQYGNHLGSASLELGKDGEVISYEEYHPYGTTAYQGVRGDTEVNPKRYRFTGMERDEETGLKYHTSRYYLPWLSRWLSSDPTGIDNGINTYKYASCNPILFVDRNGAEDQICLWESRVYHTKITATYSGRGISPYLRQTMTGVYRSWTRDYTSRIDVGHMHKPQVLLRAGEVTTVGPQLAGPNRSQGATVEREMGRQARETGQFARDTRGRDVSPSGLALRGARFPRQPFLPALLERDFARDYGQRSSPLNPDAGAPWPYNPKARPPAPGQLSLPFYGPSTRPGIYGPSTMPPTPKPIPQQLSFSFDDPPQQLSFSFEDQPQSSRRSGAPARPPTSSMRNTAVQAGTGGLGAAGRTMPMVVEAEVFLLGLAGLAAGSEYTASLVAPLVTAAEAVPVAAGVGVVGAGAGHAARYGAEELGASRAASEGIGLGAAVLTGLAFGSLIPGVGHIAGPIIGAAVAGGFYLMSR
jgi:RHS repeat-associated protein